MADKNTIKSWFLTGLKPTQAQFLATWDSFWHKDEKIPITAIDDIENILAEKANAEVLANHLTDATAHADLFLGKEDKNKKGVALGYAPLNEFVKLAIDYLDVVNDLVTGGEASLLTAEQGKLLQTQIDFSKIFNDFSPTKTITKDGFYNSFPSVIKLINGDLIMAYRKGTVHDVIGLGDIILKKSSDDGLTWSNEIVIFHEDNVDFRDPSLTQLSNGNLIMSYFTHEGVDLLNGFQAKTAQSTDNGVTWSTSVNITGYASWSAVSAPVIELNNGDLLLPIYGKDGINFKTSVVKSTNGGIYWGLVSNLTVEPFITDTTPYFGEPVIIQLPNGHILATNRNETTRYTAILKSIDNGLTWSYPVDKFPSRSRCNMNLTFNNRVIFSYRYDISPEAALSPSLSYSDDYGDTFPDKPNVLIMPNESTTDEYSSLCDLNNGVFAYVYSLEDSSGASVQADIFLKYLDSAFSFSNLDGMNVKGLLNNGSFRQFGSSSFYNKVFLFKAIQLLNDENISFGGGYNSGGEFAIKYDADRLKIYRSGDEFVILDNGNTGVNVPYPVEKFQVGGNILAEGNVKVGAGFGLGFLLEDGFYIVRKNGFTEIGYGGVSKMKINENGVDILGKFSATLNVYANDAAADADSLLVSKGFYKLTGSRVVYQKP